MKIAYLYQVFIMFSYLRVNRIFSLSSKLCYDFAPSLGFKLMDMHISKCRMMCLIPFFGIIRTTQRHSYISTSTMNTKAVENCPHIS